MPKGSKTSALDAVTQYVKNKLPQTGFFSTLDELIASAPFEKAPIDQWKSYLQPGRTFEREGVRFPLKQEELDYSWPSKEDLAGFDSLSKEDMRRWIQLKRPDFRLRVGVSLPGTDDYNSAVHKALKSRFAPEIAVGDERLPLVGQAEYGEYAHGFPDAPYEESTTRSTDFGPYTTHFDSNTLSHSRTTIQPIDEPPDRGIATGTHEGRQRLMRLIEEIQSDRHQAAAEWLRKTPGGVFAEGDGPPSVFGSEKNIWENSPRFRRGYRTPADDRRIEDLKAEQESVDSWVNYQLTRLRRNANNPDIRAAKTASQNITDELERFGLGIPDAPFKNPADYATLELKNQMLNAAKQGQDYLGMVRGSDISDRFSHEADQREGTAYTYDKVYRSALNKLARQYGIDVRDVPTTLKSSIDVATPTMRQHGIETIGDLLGDMRNHTDWTDPDDLSLHLDRIGDVIAEIGETAPTHAERAATDLEQLRNALSPYREEVQRGKTVRNPWQSDADVTSWYNQLTDDLMEGHDLYKQKKMLEMDPQESVKDFPSMVLTPEIREKILKAGVPIWALGAGLTMKQMMELGANEEPQGFADGGIARLKELAENVGTKDTTDRRKRILAGLASQLYGINPDTGEVEFLGGWSPFPKVRTLDEYRDRTKAAAEGTLHDAGPGLFDEVQSMFFGTPAAAGADERLLELKNRIRNQMDVKEPHGFQENFDEGLGTMLGQLPIPSPSKAKVVAKLPLIQKLRKLAMELPSSAVEWFSPTVNPGMKNYLTGATFGGGIGAVSDMIEEKNREERQGEDFAASWAEKHPDVGLQMADGGKVRGAKRASEWLSLALDDLVERSHGYSVRNSPQYYSMLHKARWDPLITPGDFERMEASVFPHLNVEDPVPWMDWSGINEDLDRMIEKYGMKLPPGTRLYRGMNVPGFTTQKGKPVLPAIAPQSTSLRPEVAEMYTQGPFDPVVLQGDVKSRQPIHGLPRLFLSQDEFMLPKDTKWISEAEDTDSIDIPTTLKKAEGGVVEATKPLHSMLDLLKARLNELTPGSLDMPVASDNRSSVPNEIPDMDEPIKKAEGGKVKTLLELREALMSKLKSPNVEGTGRELVTARQKLDQLKSALPEIPATPEHTTPESLIDLVNKPIPDVPSIPLQMSRRQALQGLGAMVLPDVPINPEAFLAKKALTKVVAPERHRLFGTEEARSDLVDMLESRESEDSAMIQGLDEIFQKYPRDQSLAVRSAMMTVDKFLAKHGDATWQDPKIEDELIRLGNARDQKIKELAESLGFEYNLFSEGSGLQTGALPPRDPNLRWEPFVPAGTERMPRSEWEAEIMARAQKMSRDDPPDFLSEKAQKHLDEAIDLLAIKDPDDARDHVDDLLKRGEITKDEHERIFDELEDMIDNETEYPNEGRGLDEGAFQGHEDIDTDLDGEDD